MCLQKLATWWALFRTQIHLGGCEANFKPWGCVPVKPHHQSLIMVHVAPTLRIIPLMRRQAGIRALGLSLTLKRFSVFDGVQTGNSLHLDHPGAGGWLVGSSSAISAPQQMLRWQVLAVMSTLMMWRPTRCIALKTMTTSKHLVASTMSCCRRQTS